MKRQALLAVPLLLALLAGCAGSSTTAMGLRATADREAARWDPDAQLSSVFGIEANITLPPEAREALQKQADGQADPQKVLALLSDPRVGDGLAPGWGYAYFSPKGVYGVLVGADGGITFSKQVTNFTQEDYASAQNELKQAGVVLKDSLAAWHIDSDEAATRLAAANSTFAAQVGKPEQVAIWMLNPMDRTWTMVLTPASARGASLMASISYEDGTVKSVKGFSGYSGMVPQQTTSTSSSQGQRPTTVSVSGSQPRPQQPAAESGSVDGQVSTLNMNGGGAFTILAPHDDGRLLFRVREQAAGLGTVNFNVRSPSGQEYHGSTGALIGSGSDSARFEPEVGKWTVTMAASGVSSGMDASVLWCTNGRPTQESTQNDACQDIMSASPGLVQGGDLVPAVSGWLPFATAR
jgi:hypothetical protein